jgi:TatD DNase family protein
MKLIDTHAHLDFPHLFDQLDDVLQRAQDAGVQRVVAIGASRGFESNLRALDIARRAPQMLRCTAGIHPHDASLATPEVMRRIVEELAPLPEVVAIGETGLDYHYDRSPREVQRDVFRQHLDLSLATGKPVMIHSRDAEDDTIALLDERGVTGGILHCFSGTRPFAEQLIERDFYLSFSGIVSFKTGRELLEIARDVPQDRLLVETDAPYLAPVPHRGKKNEPAFVRHTAEAIATIRGIPLEQLATLTWDNASRVFGWP